jgi:hypothetical protein
VKHRDARWWREATRQITSPLDAERFIDQVGFAACLTDSRRPGPSLYVAVCGRRDAVMPRTVQKDHEASLTWSLKDELLGAARSITGNLRAARATFIAPAHAPLLSRDLGRPPRRRSAAPEPAGTRPFSTCFARVGDGHSDLRQDSGITDRATFSRALDELQAAMLVIPATWSTSRSPTSGRSASAAFRTSSAGACRARGRSRRSPAVSSPARTSPFPASSRVSPGSRGLKPAWAIARS